MDESSPKRVAIGEALLDIEIYPLPAGEKPVSVFVMVKCVDEAGVQSWWTRATTDFNQAEMLGSLISYTDNMRREQAAQWDEDNDAPHDRS